MAGTVPFPASSLHSSIDLQKQTLASERLWRTPTTTNAPESTATHSASASTSISTTPSSLPVNKAKSLSCGTCRERKVRCDKNQPCSTCQRAKVSCIFPSAKRLPRKRQGERKKTNEKLLQRLGRLEALVEKAGLDEKEGQTAGEKKPKTKGSPNQREPIRRDRERSETSQSSGSQPAGKSVLEGEMSRYLGSNFWANLTDEVEGLRLDLIQSSDDDEDDDDDGEPPISEPRMHPSDTLPSQNGFIFSFNIPKVNLRSLHPTPMHIETLSSIYMANVDPVSRLLHRPTHSRFISGAKDNLDSIPGGSKMQALMFAMYFAAVTSLTPNECMLHFGEGRQYLLNKYRFGTEQSLVQADLLNSMEMVTLQALVIYLTCVRCEDDSRFAWTLTSLAIRIAHALDLHRDDSFASLSPFDTELRRRLWWQICVLDGRAAEDRGSDPMISEESYNTMMPLNVNDEDIDATSFQPIVERQGYTEMTFCLISQEVSVAIRQLNYVPPGLSSRLPAEITPNVTRKQRLVAACSQRLESKYLRYCDTSIPFSWATSIVTRLVMARMWLVVHKPLHRQEGGMLPQDVDREKILMTATEVIEYAHVLETEPSTLKWRWFFGTWHQWYALALVLAELCVQTQGPAVNRAWDAVDSVFDGWADSVADSRKGMLWRPIKKLRNKAQNARDGHSPSDVAMAEETLADIESNFTSQSIPPRYSNTPFTNMSDFPLASLEPGHEGLLPSSNGAQGLLPTPLSDQVDLSRWAVNDQQAPPLQSLRSQGDQFDWVGWDEFTRASQRDSPGGPWAAQLGTWWR